MVYGTFLLLLLQLPEAEVKDSVEGNKFELHSKALTGPSAATLPITLVAHKEEVKSRWLSEIRSFALDTVALQEHATDDLRIDPNHVQQVDELVLKLPQRIDSADPDSGIRPSDFAKDHFLTKSQRKVDDKCESQAAVAEKTSSSSSAVKSVVVVQESCTTDKKLQRGTAVQSEEQPQPEVTGEKHPCPTPTGSEESPSKIQKVAEKASRIPVKTTDKVKDEPTETSEHVDEKKRQEDEDKKKQLENRRKIKEEEDNERRREEDLRILEEKRRTEEEFAQRQEELTKQQELRKLKEAEEERERKSQEEAERKVQIKNEENLRKIQEAGAIDIRVVETVKTEKAVVVEVTAATEAAETTTTITTVTATKGDEKEESKTVIKVDQAAGGAGTSDGKQAVASSSGDQKASGNARGVPLKKIASKPIEDPDPPDRKPPQRNSDGAHPPTVIPDFNPPPALVYHTTFEVSLHKEPLPPPPVPPKITHKVVVHNESLEQRTEEFLRGESHSEFDAINYSLVSAQSKIKNIKSTFGKSKQETDLVDDTVRKVKSGEFTAIVHPTVPIHDPMPKQKPYEVIEIVTQPEESDKLPRDMQRKYDITKELLLTKREQKISSSSASTYFGHEGNQKWDVQTEELQLLFVVASAFPHETVQMMMMTHAYPPTTLLLLFLLPQLFVK